VGGNKEGACRLLLNPELVEASANNRLICFSLFNLPFHRSSAGPDHHLFAADLRFQFTRSVMTKKIHFRHIMSLLQLQLNKSFVSLFADFRIVFDWVSQNQKQIRD
jgi:hypothetical protein